MDSEVLFIVAAIILYVILFIGLICLGTYLWNILAVMIFGLPTITKTQFFGLMMLIRILFGNVGSVRVKGGDE